MNIKLILLAASLLFCTSFAQTTPGKQDKALPEHTIKVATFNIKYASLDDSPTAWPTRKAALLKQIDELSADIIGMQEVLLVQYSDISAAKNGYAFVGCARDDGRLRGEFSPILYNTERFALTDSGTFWLSETPEKPGSISWNSACTRICSWARFIDRKTDKAFYFYNTHLDHQSEQARMNGLKLILTRISQR
ncbi:MAG: endonuclease/exonuclease/phosphatase family protein, partial [Sedimentisphaerales bacterium]|nr:endonuclease/exonuclease/phosphatase family protein [Sedimentisphaerales bacterium]